MKRTAVSSSTNPSNKRHHPGRGPGGGGSDLGGKKLDEVTDPPKTKDDAGRELTLERAKYLTSTPLLKALPLVFKSGYLYKHELIVAGSSCRDFEDIYQDVETEIPLGALVEVKVSLSKVKEGPNKGNEEWPKWAKLRQLEDVIPTAAFAKQVFDKITDLKVAVKPTQHQQQKARDSMKKWGVDIHGVLFHVWGPNGRNSGGIGMRFYARTSQHKDPGFFRWQNEIPKQLVRLDTDLCLWTGIRTWRVYDGCPLWNWTCKEGPSRPRSFYTVPHQAWLQRKATEEKAKKAAKKAAKATAAAAASVGGNHEQGSSSNA